MLNLDSNKKRRSCDRRQPKNKKRRMEMNTTKIKKLIANSQGKIFRATFIKSDGSVRVMIARLHVHAGIKGTGYALKTKTVIRVFDMQKRAFRSIPLDRVIQLKVRGQLINC